MSTTLLPTITNSTNTTNCCHGLSFCHLNLSSSPKLHVSASISLVAFVFFVTNIESILAGRCRRVPRCTWWVPHTWAVLRRTRAVVRTYVRTIKAVGARWAWGRIRWGSRWIWWWCWAVSRRWRAVNRQLRTGWWVFLSGDICCRVIVTWRCGTVARGTWAVTRRGGAVSRWCRTVWWRRWIVVRRGWAVRKWKSWAVRRGYVIGRRCRAVCSWCSYVCRKGWVIWWWGVRTDYSMARLDCS